MENAQPAKKAKKKSLRPNPGVERVERGFIQIRQMNHADGVYILFVPATPSHGRTPTVPHTMEREKGGLEAAAKKKRGRQTRNGTVEKKSDARLAWGTSEDKRGAGQVVCLCLGNYVACCWSRPQDRKDVASSAQGEQEREEERENASIALRVVPAGKSCQGPLPSL